MVKIWMNWSVDCGWLEKWNAG